jgi:hypothetical protein
MSEERTAAVFGGIEDDPRQVVISLPNFHQESDGFFSISLIRQS